MMKKYVLIGKKTREVDDLFTWCQEFEKSNRTVKQDKIGEILVLTVFLGIDHNFVGGRPLLFETMVFEGKFDGVQERCSTWEEAEKQHEKMFVKVKGRLVKRRLKV